MSTPNILFELMRNTGFIKDDKVDFDRVSRATPTEIIDLSAERIFMREKDTRDARRSH